MDQRHLLRGAAALPVVPVGLTLDSTAVIFSPAWMSKRMRECVTHESTPFARDPPKTLHTCRKGEKKCPLLKKLLMRFLV